MQFNITRQEAEALVDLLEKEDQPWPLDLFAKELREKFGMVTKEREAEYRAQLAINNLTANKLG